MQNEVSSNVKVLSVESGFEPTRSAEITPVQSPMYWNRHTQIVIFNKFSFALVNLSSTSIFGIVTGS